MADPMVFEVFEGMVEIQFAYWSTDKKAVLPDDDRGMIVYGEVDNDNPLYFHVRIQDLFLKSDKAWRIQHNTTLHVDLYGIHHSMYQQLQVKEDFDKLGDYIKPVHSFKLNLTEGKDVIIKEGDEINGYELKDCVEGFNDAPFTAYLTKVPGRNATTALNAFDYDICFEFKADDTLKKKLFEQSVLRKYVFAWVWVAHKVSKKEYSTAFNIDITSPQKRFEFLKKPDKNFFGAIDILFSPLTKAKRYSRSQLYMQKFVDGFPYDEQTMNYIELSRSLPIKSLMVGAQIGPVGITTMDTHYFARYLQGHRTYTSTFLVDGTPALRCKLDSDKNFRPDYAADRGVVLHGLESKLNEFYSRADNRFFFKEKSISHWINSLEKKYADSNVENGMDTVVVKGSLPFTSGKLELLVHDFVKKYRSESDLLKRYAGSERFIEQKTFDMNTFETIHIAPSNEIKSADGTFHAKIGKGFPGSDKFIDTMHSRAFFGNDPDTWQAHAICQRPLVVTYELDRDLDSEEIDLIKKNPIKLHFWFGKPEKKSYIELPLIIDYAKACKKGHHAILVYIITNDVKVEVSVYGDIAPVDNYQLRDGTPARLFDCGCELPETFEYYNPEDTGLFNGNPVIIVDDYQEDEIKEKALSKIRKEYVQGIKGSSVKFLLGFVPGVVGKGISLGWELFSEWDSKGKVSSKTAIDSADKGLKLLLTDILKKKDSDRLLNYKNYETALKVMKFAEQINSITSKYIESSTLVSSPLFDGAGFGEKPQADSLYLMAVGTGTIKIDKKTLVATKADSAGDFAFFCNREIIRQGMPPFNYQFGDTGGLLARKDGAVSDSLSPYRVDYQQKLVSFKESFSNEIAVTLPQYLKKLAATTPGTTFSDMLKKASANKSLISYFDTNGLAQKFQKGLTNASTLTEDEKVVLTTFLNLVMYIDASFAYCPACGNIVSLSWGWCPYHATRELLDLQDVDGDGKFKEEFLSRLIELRDYNRDGNPTITDVLRSPVIENSEGNRERLFVHWSEFIIS